MYIIQVGDMIKSGLYTHMYHIMTRNTASLLANDPKRACFNIYPALPVCQRLAIVMSIN